MFIVKRTGSALITVFAVSIFLFLMLQVVPGDPVLSKLGMDEMEQNPELAAQLREEFQLDQPIPVRYYNWISKVAHGDLGRSFKYDNYTVNELIGKRLTTTVVLTGLSLLVIVAAGLWIGVRLAEKEGTRMGDLANMLSQIGLALPSFWVAILVLGFFGAKLGWFPIRGKIDVHQLAASLRSLILPVLTLSIGGVASVSRYLKTALIEEKHKEYVLVARSKGLEDYEIMRTHVFKNSLIPVTTIIGLLFIGLMTGSIIIENVFSLSGIGNLLITAINSSDYPVIQGVVLYYSLIVVAVSLILDLLYGVIDPRIRIS